MKPLFKIEVTATVVNNDRSGAFAHMAMECNVPEGMTESEWLQIVAGSFKASPEVLQNLMVNSVCVKRCKSK